MNHVGSMCFHWGKCLTSSLKRLSHGWRIAIFGLKPRPEKSPAIGTTCGMWSLNYRIFLMVPITLSGFGRMLQTTSKIKTSLWYASEVFWMTKPTPSISAFLWCCAERILDPSFSFFLIPWEKNGWEPFCTCIIVGPANLTQEMSCGYETMYAYLEPATLPHPVSWEGEVECFAAVVPPVWLEPRFKH